MPPPELAEYFAAERQGGPPLVALSLVGFGFAGFLWLTRNAFAAAALAKANGEAACGD